MTTTTVSQEAREVTQADRDAALPILCHLYVRKGEEPALFIGEVRAGKYDDHYLVQAFARHRQQAERAFEERERELREALKEISELHGEINPSNYDHDDACELNRQFCYALTVADLAIKEIPDAQ